MQTSKIKLGMLVACNSFRNPALMAKMASTLDSITNGRVILGIGAGWHRPEYEAYGYEYPSVRERMERLEESIRIIRAMLRQGTANFQGKYYMVKNAPSIQVAGHMVPVWVGGGGPRLVRMAARLSDGWNAYRMKMDELKNRYKMFETEAKKKGRLPGELTVSMVTEGMIAGSKSTVEKLVVSAARERGQSRDQYKIQENVIVGNADEAVRTIRPLRDVGVQHLIVNFPAMDLPEQLEYFGDEVIPRFSS